MDIGSLLDWERPTDIDSDDLAVLLAAVFDAEGRPYAFHFKSDGATFVSVECVPSLKS